jgi:AraC-like DNA-binding protein
MVTVYRCADVPPGAFVDYWRQVSRDTFGPAELRPAGSPQRLLVGEVGPVRVAEMTTGGVEQSAPCEGTRSRTVVRRAGQESYGVHLVLRGQMVIEQDGRQCRIRPGDFALLDMSRPARWAASAERFVALMFPRVLLPVSPDDVAGLTAVRIPGDTGTGALFASLTGRLADRLDDYGEIDGIHVGTAVLDLLAASLTARSEGARPGPPDERQRVLLMRIHAFIEERLADPALTPGVIAAAHHISVRYLYKLFETRGESVAGRIRRRRLEQCRRHLIDPTSSDRSVGAIAAAHGLTNAGHFSRTFKMAFGLSPRDYRAAYLGRPDPGVVSGGAASDRTPATTATAATAAGATTPSRIRSRPKAKS